MAIIRKLVLLLSLLSSSNLSFGLPNGAPVSACGSLRPLHHKGDTLIDPQPDSTFPYMLESSFLEDDVLNAGDSVTIKLSANFQGFLIEARQGGKPIGTFDVAGDENTKTLSCEDGENNAITHTSPTVKESITATWVAPSHFDRLEGAVEYHVTVAQNHDTFWVNHVVVL